MSTEALKRLREPLKPSVYRGKVSDATEIRSPSRGHVATICKTDGNREVVFDGEEWLPCDDVWIGGLKDWFAR